MTTSDRIELEWIQAGMPSKVFVSVAVYMELKRESLEWEVNNLFLDRPRPIYLVGLTVDPKEPRWRFE